MIRIGQSTDVHRLERGHQLILGGVLIDSEKGLVGHSDADCLLHVVAESLIGALALGDLGTFFPDDDPSLKGISSTVLVKEIMNEVKKRNYYINNIDTLIFAEKPKMKSYIYKMKENIAYLLETNIDNVNVKATTYEKLGIVGKEEAIICESVVLLKKKATIKKL